MDRLDDFIKGKLENDAIEFNESHWMQASHLIEVQAQEKRRRLGFWLFTGQLFGVLLLLFFVLWGTVSPITTPLVKNQNSKNIAQDIVINTPEESKNQQSKKQVVNAKKQLSEEVGKVKGNQQKENEEPLNNQRTKTVDTKNESQSIVRESEKINSKPNTFNTKKKKKRNETLNQGVLKNNNPKTVLSIGAIPILGTLNSSSTQEKIEIFEENILSQNRYGVAGYIPVQLKLLTFDFDRKLNGTPRLEGGSIPLYFTLNAYAASSFYPYPQTGSKRLIGYVGGLDFTLNRNKKWAIETGIRYRIRGGFFLASQKSEQISFDFGKVTETHLLLPEAIHTFEIPLVVSFTKNKHKGIIGASYARLIGIRGSLNVTDDIPKPANFLTEIGSGWIEDSKFKKNNFTIIAGYTYAMSTRFSIGGEVHYRLNPFLNENNDVNFYTESKSIFIDFGIRYNLIKR